jgi:RNA polymerase primary sigma factor
MMATAVAVPTPRCSVPRCLPASDAGLESYLRELANLLPLSMDDEERLVQGLLLGRPRARDELIQGSLWLVPVIAVEYLDATEGLIDLVEQGNLGLIRAAEAYRVADGPFCTFAAGHVCLAIELYLKGVATHAIPVH